MSLIMSFGARLPVRVEQEIRLVKARREVERLHRILDVWTRVTRPSVVLCVSLGLVAALAVYMVAGLLSDELALGVAFRFAILTAVLWGLVVAASWAFCRVRVEDSVLAWCCIAPMLVLLGASFLIVAVLAAADGSDAGSLRAAPAGSCGILLASIPFARSGPTWDPRSQGRAWARRYGLARLRRLSRTIDEVSALGAQDQGRVTTTLPTAVRSSSAARASAARCIG